MLAPYSSPATGFMSLHPVADLGDDEAVALWRAGVRKGDLIQRASGRALLISGTGKPTVVMLGASSAQTARESAIRALPQGEVVLLQAAFRGRFTVFERKEVLRALTPAEAAKDDGARLVSATGVLVQKALSPADPVDARIIAQRLAGQLQYDERVVFKPQIEAYVERLNVDWGKLSATQMAERLSKVRTDIFRMMNGTATKVMPTWSNSIQTTVTGVFKATRKVLQNNFLPSVGLSLQQPDLRAVRVIGEQNGWWMRNAAGVRSDALTRQARGIVQDGLKQGLGRNEIGAMLQKQIPGAWQAMGQRYFNAVASVAVSRGRSYSEVSGYLEVGIEALEVQAVLDERTTEICRCLDGQIIETNIVSQQIIGALNVPNPEDIRDASPFLTERLNRETGMKEIVTANNGARVAEIVRSGMGRADDRGQFNMFRQGNGLADINIGPPPYHHLCRSWTVPVATTVSVPRDTTPRAIETPTPIPPRALPTGTKPPAGVGPRPIIPNPTPGPTRPVTVGDRDLVDRYPFTDDFVNPAALPRSAFDPVTGELLSGAVGQRFAFDAEARLIRAAGNEFTVPLPAPGKHPLSELVNKLDLTAQHSGVMLHVSKADVGSVRRIILSEAEQPAAVRVYSVRSADTGRTTYLRFDHNLKGGAKDEIRALRRAVDEQQMAQAITKLEEKGFVKSSGNAGEVLFGNPAPKMPPAPAPKPKMPAKRPGPAPKPKPITAPTVRPKPKPTTTAVSPTGQVQPKPAPAPKPKPAQPPKPQYPKPGPAKDFSEYGLLKKVPLDQQFKERVSRETARLRDFLKQQEASFQQRLGRAMRPYERGEKIREFVAADTGKASQITLEQIRTRSAKVGGTKWTNLKKSFTNKLEQGSMRIGNDKVIAQARLKKVSPEMRQQLFNEAFEHLSQRVLDASLRARLPNVYFAEGVQSGAFHSSLANAIVLPDWRYKGMDALRQTFRHELGHYVETLGKSGEAAQMFRKSFQFSTKLKSGPTYEYVEGKWADRYTGRVYKGWEEKIGEVTSTTAEVFAKNSTKDIGLTYDTNPDQIGFFMAQAKGSFIP